jgi:hypothetical protein
MKSFSVGEYHYVYGEVYAPLQIDTDGETMAAGDIKKMAHDFLASGKVDAIDVNHSHVMADGVEVVESFIARKDDADYREGAWVLGVRMKEGAVWDAVKSGELNGFSMDAFVKKVSKRVLVEIDKIVSGDTETASSDDMPTHIHVFYVEFDSDGKVAFGTTSEEIGHVHKIFGTVVTEKACEHSHRYFIE